MKKTINYLFLFIFIFLFSCENVKEVSITVDESTIPEFIYLDDDFDISLIKIKINYSDDSTKTINLDESMISIEDIAKLKTIGSHKIEVKYGNLKSDFIVSVIEKDVYFEVNFYDINNNIIKTETVKKGNAATPPELEEIRFYKFEGWDMEYSNVVSNLDIKPIYKKQPNYLYYELDNDYDGKFIKFAFSSDVKIAGFQIELLYDTSKLQTRFISSNSSIICNAKVPGKITFNFSTGNNIVQDMELIKVYYLADENDISFTANIISAKYITDTNEVENTVITKDKLLGN